MKTISDNTVRAKILLILTKSAGIVISITLLCTVIYLVFTKNSSDIPVEKFAVATEDISAQEVITEKNISFQPFVEGFTPKNGIRETQVKELIGKKTYLQIKKGDVLSISYFGLNNGTISGGIASFIPKNKKLVYLKNEDVHTFPSEIQKNNRIDLIAVNQKQDNNNIKVLAENIDVFDIALSKDEEADGISKIGLLMSDKEVLDLSSVLTSDWKINIALHPQNETVKDSLINVASSEGTFVNPSPNEKKDSR